MSHPSDEDRNTGDTDDSPATIARGERWPPLGAAAQDTPRERSCSLDSEQSDYWMCSRHDDERLRLMEEEQEHLNSSLMALTSHFAQVQFRLKQIVDAEPDSKERLLRELEQFAFRGVPDLRQVPKRLDDFVGADVGSEGTAGPEDKMSAHRTKQLQLIAELKSQLEDLEHYAYETGEAGMPQNLIVERQKVIIDQMTHKLPLNVDALEELSLDELRQQVDQAIGQLVNPIKMKDQLVTQLKTQISDLERFIDFLQGPGGAEMKPRATKDPDSTLSYRVASDLTGFLPEQVSREQAEERRQRIQLTMRRVSQLLQLYVVSQFGCGSGVAAHTTAGAADSGPEWLHLKARLDHAVHQVLWTSSTGASRSSDGPAPVVRAVRKGLCPALRDLMGHGLVQPNGSGRALVPFLSCVSPAAPTATAASLQDGDVHPWHLLMAYFRLRDGPAVMTNPQRSLAQSFSLEVHGVTNSKQGLLAAIGDVLESHGPYKRRADAQFKAWVSKALNAKKLVAWLRLVYRSPSLIDEFYEPWSYAAQTGFDDACKTLEALHSVPFHLPDDLSIRTLRNMFDAF